MSKVDLGDATYTGLDIVDALIASNTARFADENASLPWRMSQQIPCLRLIF